MRVYCLGDSTTYGFGVSRREAWPALVGAATGHEMINGGVNGDATSGTLARFCVDVPRHGCAVTPKFFGCPSWISGGCSRKCQILGELHSTSTASI